MDKLSRDQRRLIESDPDPTYAGVSALGLRCPACGHRITDGQAYKKYLAEGGFVADLPEVLTRPQKPDIYVHDHHEDYLPPDGYFDATKST